MSVFKHAKTPFYHYAFQLKVANFMVLREKLRSRQQSE